MKTLTRFLLGLAFVPLFLYSSEARASDLVITGGSCQFTFDGSLWGGHFSLTNERQGFTASGGMINGFGPATGAMINAFKVGETVSPSIRVSDILGGRNNSVTIGGVTYSPVYYIGGSPNSIFFFTGSPLVLPPRDPSQPPDQSFDVSFKVPFTFTGTLTGWPCDPGPIGRPRPLSSTVNCEEPLFSTSPSGQGTATVIFHSYYSQLLNDYVYSIRSITYNFESANCLSTISVGNGAQKFGFCVTDRGTIRDFESPKTLKHLTSREGYALCGSTIGQAFDDGEIDSGWGAPSVLQPGGANTLPLTITRLSPGNQFELKQTFVWDADERDVTITMTLKNISGATITGVKLARYFDGDISNDAGDDRYAVTADSVWGWEDGPGAGSRGLMLTALTAAYHHAPAVEKFLDWDPAAGGAQTARSCTPVSQKTPTGPGNYVGRITYSFGPIPAGGSRTVKLLYRRF